MSEQALTQPCGVAADQRLPLSSTRQRDFGIRRGVGAWVARVDQDRPLSTVSDRQDPDRPDHIAQVSRRLEFQLGDLGHRNPAIGSVHDDLEHGAEAGVGVGEPVKPTAIDAAGFGRCRFKRARAQLESCLGGALGLLVQRFDQIADPGLRISEDPRCCSRVLPALSYILEAFANTWRPIHVPGKLSLRANQLRD